MNLREAEIMSHPRTSTLIAIPPPAAYDFGTNRMYLASTAHGKTTVFTVLWLMLPSNTYKHNIYSYNQYL